MAKAFITFLLLAILGVAACDNKEPEALSQQQLRALMLDSLNHSAESWWYLGSDNERHYISIERPGTAHLYSVLVKKVTIKVPRLEYSSKKNHRIKLKKTKIKLIK